MTQILNASVEGRAVKRFSRSGIPRKSIMTTYNPLELEPIEPGQAQELYLKHKASECTKKTVQGHRYRTNHFVRWCALEGIGNLNDLTGRNLHEYRLWREEDGDLNKVSVQTQMSTLRVFLKWCGSIEAVDPDLFNKVLVPSVSADESRRHEMLDGQRAREILDHLSKYQYASRTHALLAILVETGMRIGAARSLDVCDVYIDDRYLDLQHRPSQGTTLKNGKGGERPVAMKPSLTRLLDDYIDHTRPDVVDDHGRHPLIAGNQGRLSRSSMRRIVYRLTAPCFLGKDCPGCTGGSEDKCPEAVNPHAVRRGAITNFLTNDVPVEVVGDRMDVSRKVLDEHYDERSDLVKLEQRRRFLDNI